MAPPSICWMRARIAFAVIGILVGVSVLFVFGLKYNNWNCALWGFISGIFAAVTLFVHIQYMRGYWALRLHTLKRFMLTGCFVQLAGVCGFVVYLVLGIVLNQGLIIEGNQAFYLTTVWCFMTWKWGFLLFYFSRSYRRLLDVSAYKDLDEPTKT